jgi:hypothetical protein
VTDVLVTCHAHDPELKLFPQVRGYYLAKHLRAAGIDARFAQLPVPDGSECEVLICSEFLCPMDWFDRHLAAPLAQVRAQRMFCMSGRSLYGREDHFAREYCEWFGERGGVLCHMTDGPLLPYEHCIGVVGVDPDAVRPAWDQPRDTVVFDFPRGGGNDMAAVFDVARLGPVRERLPDCRVVGTGPPDAPIRHAFDAWVEYGQPHATYVARMVDRAFAFVVGWHETMGLAVAEAQVAGASIVSSPWQVRDEMLCPEAAVSYDADEPHSLAEALAEARTRDARVVHEQALERFDYGALVARTRAAVGL